MFSALWQGAIVDPSCPVNGKPTHLSKSCDIESQVHWLNYDTYIIWVTSRFTYWNIEIFFLLACSSLSIIDDLITIMIFAHQMMSDPLIAPEQLDNRQDPVLWCLTLEIYDILYLMKYHNTNVKIPTYCTYIWQSARTLTRNLVRCRFLQNKTHSKTIGVRWTDFIKYVCIPGNCMLTADDDAPLSPRLQG